MKKRTIYNDTYLNMSKLERDKEAAKALQMAFEFDRKLILICGFNKELSNSEEGDEIVFFNYAEHVTPDDLEKIINHLLKDITETKNQCKATEVTDE